MPYVGNKPEVGNFRKCDAITTSATATYNLLVGGVAVNPNQNQCIVSLNGVIQSSGNSYTIASSQITFASALTSSDVIDFILILGDTLDVGVPSDDTVSTAKLQANAVTTAKITDGNITGAKFNADVISSQTELATTPADTDEFLISDAGTIKRIDYSHIKGGGSWELIYSDNVSSLGDGSKAYTDSSMFSSTYNFYRIYILDWEPQNDSVDMNLQFKLGASTRTSNYRFNLRRNESNSDNVNGAYDNSGGSIRIMEGCGNGTSENMSGWFEYQNPTTDTGRWYVTSCMYAGIESNGYTIGGVGQGSCSDSTAAMTGFTIAAHSGGLGDYKLRAYGLKQS